MKEDIKNYRRAVIVGSLTLVIGILISRLIDSQFFETCLESLDSEFLSLIPEIICITIILISIGFNGRALYYFRKYGNLKKYL